MVDAPEHIWLLPHDGEQRCWCDHPDPSGMGHEDEADEYIRADLVAALEAENQRLRATLSAITATDCYSRDECTAMARAALSEKAEAERDQAIKALSKAAKARGRAEGKLAASELPGIIDGWKARAEKAEAALDKMLAEARLEGWRAGRDAAARSCVLSRQDLAEGDWGPEGRYMAVMFGARIRALPEPKEASYEPS